MLKKAIYQELPKLVGKHTMINDHISDMLTRLNNAYSVGKKTVSMPYTKILERVAAVMLEEKYLSKVEAVEVEGKHKELKLALLYQNGNQAMAHVKRISKPGVRIYRQRKNFKPVLSGLGIAILSTSKGVMSDRKARELRVGGEVLAELW